MIDYTESHKSTMRDLKTLNQYKKLMAEFADLKIEQYDSVNKICESDKEVKEDFEIWQQDYENNREHLDYLQDTFNRIGKEDTEKLLKLIKTQVKTNDVLSFKTNDSVTGAQIDING